MPSLPVDRAFRLKRLRYPQYADNLQHQFTAQTANAAGYGKGSFERGRAVRAEDHLRRNKLLLWAGRALQPNGCQPVQHFSPAHARELARRLKRLTGGAYPAQTFASSAYMRRFRLRFVGAALKLIRTDPTVQVVLGTVVPRDWRVPGRALPTVKPKQYLERFRQQLIRAGLRDSDGWMIAFLHGDYDPTHDTYQLHLHVVATTKLIPLIDKLRSLPMYRPGDPTQLGYVRQPIRVMRLSNPERRVSYYLAQAFWPSKPSYQRYGIWRRHPHRQRIPDLRLAEWLMWIDRQSFSDLIMLRGCRFRDGALVLSSAASRAV